MPEFLTLISPNEALERLILNLSIAASEEEIASTMAIDRTTTRPIFATHTLPAFARSVVDGYAVAAEDTYGVSDSQPCYLALNGEILMGEDSHSEVKRGTCSLIHTGGKIPAGANAVVMVEDTQKTIEYEIEIVRSVAPGENVIQVGEDIVEGDEIIPMGTKIRSVEIGGLMALGVLSIKVAKQPKIGIISTGDELIHPKETPTKAQIRDINSHTISNIIHQAGGEPGQYGICPDNYDAIIEVAFQALTECDGLVITAGSSASNRDITAQIINDLGKPGVLVHGIKLKPGKPTILGVCNGKPVFGLPGNPVSCMVTAWFLVAPAIRYMMGDQRGHRATYLRAVVGGNIQSKAGIEEWVPVKLGDSKLSEEKLKVAYPIFSRSNLIFSLLKADGLAHIPMDANGVENGDWIDVFMIE